MKSLNVFILFFLTAESAPLESQKFPSASTQKKPRPPAAYQSMATQMLMHPKATTTAHGSRKMLTLYVALGAAAVICVIVLAGVLVLLMRRRRAKTNKALRDTLKNKSNVLDIVGLREVSEAVIGSSKEAQKMLVSIAEEDKVGKRTLREACGARCPKIKVLASTQVSIKSSGAALHMNRMRDYEGNPLLLGQTPEQSQHNDYWRALWQEKVGITVWISSDANVSDISSLLPDEGVSIKRAEFKITSTAVVKCAGQYVQCLVEVSKSRGKKQPEIRQLVFLILCMWPSAELPQWPGKLVDFVERLEQHQQTKRSQGIPTLLIQCSNGIDRSPAFAAAYIGRQIYISQKKVNLIGLLRYIRQNRHMAFGGADATIQLQIVVGLLRIVSMRTEMGNVGELTVQPHEREIFDENVRRAEIDQIVENESYITPSARTIQASSECSDPSTASTKRQGRI